MIKIRLACIALVLAAAGCSPPASEMAEPSADASAVPAEFAAMVTAAVPGITITSGELSASNEQYEVTGTLPNGDEVEVDIVRANGTWSVQEIQRDVPWSSVPEPVRAAAAAAPDAFEPVRVIESTQTADGALVYELFRVAGAGGGPDLEVRWHEGTAAVLP